MITFFLGLSLFVLIRLMRRYVPIVPAPLLAIVLSILLVQGLALTGDGVATVGTVPAGFRSLHMPSFIMSELPSLVTGGCGIVLVSFCSMMTTARAFAVKNGYGIRVNQDMAALGVSDLASALGGGFAVSGADSRTAVADTSGGRTQLTSIVAALVMMMVLLFLTAPLASVPTAALAAILIASAIGLFNIASLRRYYKISKVEFRFSLIATLGVMTVGVLPGVLIAVALSMLNF